MDQPVQQTIETFLGYEILNNFVSEYLLALLIFLIGILIINFIVKGFILKRLRKWINHSHIGLNSRLIKIFQNSITPLLYLGVLYISIRNLELHPILNQSIDVIGLILATFIGIRFIGNVIEYLLATYWLKGEDDEAREQSIAILAPALRIITWTIGIIFLLGNLGFNISALIASLGIGGIAIALAAQGIFQELFSYFSILLDRPVKIGDFIIVGDLIGTVEHIGIKTTRLRSLSGEELILSNSDLTSSRIRNYKRMEERRIAFTIGVTYETSLEQLQAIPQYIQAIVEQTENTRFDRCHFSNYGDFSLNFETVYYMETPDYTAYMDAQQKINFAIKECFEAQNIEIAYPTQVHYLSQRDELANPIT
ncbi:MAG: mechanosensitive ion channel [Cyanobacteria bacterium]|nr:mechanosensitive ion channel [Cyanobacteria bacterium GSL.Bin21]